MYTLLIISASHEAIPGIKIAKKIGCYVVATDGSANAPGFKYADDFIIASTYDVNDTLKKVQSYHKNKRKFDGVIAIAADVPLTVAVVSNELNLNGIPINSAEISMNKLLMKQLFASHNIPSARFDKICTFDEFKNQISQWEGPKIIKPVDSRGARGVLKLTNETDLSWAWNESIKHSPSSTLIIEDYLEGLQLSTESVIINGQSFTIGYSDRNYELLNRYAPHVIENGSDMPSIISEKTKIDINNTIQECAKIFRIKNGVIKGDIVINENKVKVIEIALRLSGGYFSTNMIPLSTGVNLIDVAIKIALNKTINKLDLKPRFQKFISQRYFFPKSGTIKSMSGVTKIKENKSIKFFDIRKNIGDKIMSPTMHPSRIGMVVASGKSRADSINNAEKAINSLKIDYV